MKVDYTLGDLLANPNLELTLLSGSQDAFDLPIFGAHSIELENPARWLDPGWLMMTMGIRLRNRPEAQRQLIADLQQLGAAALAFGVGATFKAVPPALLKEAEARNFPVILVPDDTPFPDIIRVVFQSTVSTEAQTFTRLTSLQQNLMRGLAEKDPVDATLRRLSRFSSATAALVGSDGTVYGSTGPLPHAEIALRLLDRPLRAEPMEIDDFEIVSAPLNSWRVQHGVSLVLASKKGVARRSTIESLLAVGTPIFEALGQLTAVNRRQEQALTKAMLEAAIHNKLSDLQESQFEDHLSSLGIDPGDKFNCVAIQEDTELGDGTVLDSLEEYLQNAGANRLPSVFMRSEGALILVVSDEFSTIEYLRHAIDPHRFDRLRVGVGRSIASVADLSVSYRDALIVLRYMSQEDVGAALTFGDLDLASQLLAEVPAERVALKVRELTELLQSNTLQLEAIRAYFGTCQNVREAAKKIFVHPNTLRYRLERFEVALGRSLRDPAVIASLHYVLSVLVHDEAPRRGKADNSEVSPAAGIA